MLAVPEISVINGSRTVHFGPVTDEIADRFAGSQLPDAAVHEYFLGYLNEADTVAWGVRSTEAGRDQEEVAQAVGIVALSSYGREMPDAAEIDNAHQVWYGMISNDRKRRSDIRVPTAAIAAAIATGYGLRFYDHLYFLAYNLSDKFSMAKFTEAGGLGYSLRGPMLVGDVEVPEMEIFRTVFGSPEDGDYVPLALRSLSKKLQLVSDISSLPRGDPGA